MAPSPELQVNLKGVDILVSQEFHTGKVTIE